MVDVPFWFNLMVYLDLYWYLALPAIVIGGYYGLIKMFTAPLLTRNPHELIIIFGPVKASVVKVTSRYLPFFVWKRGLYWFGEPHQVGHNLLHIYFEGINQPITDLKRFDSKEDDMLSQRELGKQVKSHTVLLPPSLKSFIRSWILMVTVGNDEKIANVELLTVSEARKKGLKVTKPHYKLGFFKRVGIYEIQHKIAEGANASAQLQTVTVQTVIQKIGDVVKGTNFNAAYMLKVLKGLRDLEKNWTMWLTGAFDMKIILIMVIIVGIMAAVFLLYKPPSLEDIGPPPPGI